MALLDKIKDLLPGAKKSGSGGAYGQTGKQVNRRVLIFGVLLVVAIAIMATLFTLASLLSGSNATYSALVSEQRIIVQKIELDVAEITGGDNDGFEQLDSNRDRYLGILRILDSGDNKTGISPLPKTFSKEYSRLKTLWNSYNKGISGIIDSRDLVDKMNQQGTLAAESMPELIDQADSILKALGKVEAPRSNIIATARLLALMRGIDSGVRQISSDSFYRDVSRVSSQVESDNSPVAAASSQLTAEMELAETLMLAMLKGDEKLGIRRITDPKLANTLRKAADVFDVAKDSINEVLGLSEQLFLFHETAQKVKKSSPALMAASDQLLKRIKAEDEQLDILKLAGYGFGFISLVLLIISVWIVINESRIQLSESQDQNDKNQRAILRLLDEMTNLADGDLSTHTTVTEDITGAIADSVNYSIDALRDLVGTINKTSVQVSSAVQKTQGTTGQLAEASTAQTREITGASETITHISQSMLDVSEKAADSAEVARKSVSIAHKGGETVRQTIAGMETIREQIQETSKRIKRLGESSQEIGDIVNLITEISDQTNILALNAAIQASMAGEAGRGFAVVADEVQRLAERTGDATKQIEALVKTIQADTNEATVSMEQSTANVVKGAKLTENAGSALDRIEQVSMNLAQRILEISDATKSQADESVKITQTMDAIQSITQKTSEGSTQASQSIGELTQMVNAMQNSVAGFKLPGMSSVDSTMVSDQDELSSRDLLSS